MSYLVCHPHIVLIGVVDMFVFLVLATHIADAERKVETEKPTEAERVAVADSPTPVQVCLIALMAEIEIVTVQGSVDSHMVSAVGGARQVKDHVGRLREEPVTCLDISGDKTYMIVKGRSRIPVGSHMGCKRHVLAKPQLGSDVGSQHRYMNKIRRNVEDL